MRDELLERQAEVKAAQAQPKKAMSTLEAMQQHLDNLQKGAVANPQEEEGTEEAPKQKEGDKASEDEEGSGSSYYDSESDEEEQEEAGPADRKAKLIDQMDPDEVARQILDAADLGYLKNLDQMLLPTIKETKH